MALKAWHRPFCQVVCCPAFDFSPGLSLPTAYQVEGLITREIQFAKEYIASKRRERALLHVRKKKLHEQSVDKIDAYLLNVEQVRHLYCHGYTAA